MSTKNCVWIELELPSREDPKLGEKRADMASKMLKKLGVDFGEHPAVWFDKEKHRYAFVVNSIGNFVWASDHGQWFDLDKLAE
jgi:hypothetical protein